MLVNRSSSSFASSNDFVVNFHHFHHFLLSGTNVDEARRLLKESGLPITPAADLTDAAEKAVSSLS